MCPSRYQLPMEIAAVLTTLLSPFLPQLLKLGQPVAEEAGKQLGAKLGEGTWETAKAAWAKLSPKVAAKPLGQDGPRAAFPADSSRWLGEDSQDAEAQAILTSQLEKLLAAHPDLAADLQQLLNTEAEAVSQVVNVTQTVTGDRNITIGSASGGVNISQG